MVKIKRRYCEVVESEKPKEIFDLKLVKQLELSAKASCNSQIVLYRPKPETVAVAVSKLTDA